MTNDELLTQVYKRLAVYFNNAMPKQIFSREYFYAVTKNACIINEVVDKIIETGNIAYFPSVSTFYAIATELKRSRQGANIKKHEQHNYFFTEVMQKIIPVLSKKRVRLNSIEYDMAIPDSKKEFIDAYISYYDKNKKHPELDYE